MNVHGGGNSFEAALSRYTTLLQTLYGMLRQATAEELGIKFSYISLAALNPIVTPLSHSSSPHRYVNMVYE